MNQQSISLSSFLTMWLRPKLHRIAHWWIERIECHYLICAEVEAGRLKDAQLNVAHYQKLAAIARSDKMKFK